MSPQPIGWVVIGRNEGEQLRRCLESIRPFATTIVYVDSDSSDNSVDLARSCGADVVELDMSIPFTAARARNEGFRRLLQIEPDLEFVHFLDGDTEIVDGWFESAMSTIREHPRAAVLSGLRMEKYPDRSVFNRLCDVEWNKPDGYPACEGDAVMRVEAFRAINGFNESLIAGEEPELCLRYWNAGWECLRNRVPMTLHDVGLLHWSQWWRREKRTGYTFAEGAAMYGKAHYLRQSMGVWFWALVLPVLGIALAWPTYGISVAVVLLGYGVLLARAYRGTRSRAKSTRHALEYATFIVLAKFPMLAGMLQYWLGRVRGRRARIIEYRKHAPV